jgi:leucyl/phenylalanyl-tRNA---protein transferase
VITWLKPNSPFPSVEKALVSPNGLLAAGGDLTPERILDAYAHGIFPWFSVDEPVLWWSPDPRMVMFPDEFKLSHSLGKTVKSGKFEVRFDTHFREVMQQCAAPREANEGTWIVPEMIDAYTSLHKLGFAHSVEAWRDGKLVGGLYGMALGKVFYGESMFARETDASKVALVALVEQLRSKAFQLIDCQQETRHLASLGARPIRRREFVQKLKELIHFPLTPSPWIE